MTSKQKAGAVFVVLVLVCVAQYSHSKMLAALAATNQVLIDEPLLPDPRAIKLVSLGYDRLLADMYWLSFTQYVGDRKNRLIDHYSATRRYLDLITSLDPKSTTPYFFGMFIIGGDQHCPQQAAELIERGIKANPDSWYLLFIAGLNQYLNAGNELAAARYYRIAATMPQSPPWLSEQAKLLDAKLPPVYKRINLWHSMYASTFDREIKMRAREELVRLWARVYRDGSENLKARAKRELHSLGVDIIQAAPGKPESDEEKLLRKTILKKKAETA